MTEFSWIERLAARLFWVLLLAGALFSAGLAAILLRMALEALLAGGVA